MDDSQQHLNFILGVILSIHSYSACTVCIHFRLPYLMFCMLGAILSTFFLFCKNEHSTVLLLLFSLLDVIISICFYYVYMDVQGRTFLHLYAGIGFKLMYNNQKLQIAAQGSPHGTIHPQPGAHHPGPLAPDLFVVMFKFKLMYTFLHFTLFVTVFIHGSIKLLLDFQMLLTFQIKNT